MRNRKTGYKRLEHTHGHLNLKKYAPKFGPFPFLFLFGIYLNSKSVDKDSKLKKGGRICERYTIPIFIKPKRNARCSP